MKRLFSALAALCLALALLPISARADMGPKPQITIRVENAPEAPYYLDLLIPADADAAYDNLRWNQLDAAALDQTLVSSLRALAADGEQLAMLDGTSVPMHGQLERADDVFVFGYHGAPETFRIALATANGGQVSETVTRTLFQQKFTYDFSTGTVTTHGSEADSILRQFCATFFPTILIEGIVLLLFGFSLKQNWKAFLLANLGTQLILTLTIGLLMLRGGSFVIYFLFWPVEAVIVWIEALIYRRYLRGGRGLKPHPVAYALTANLLSALAGFYSLNWLRVWIFPR